MADQFEGVGGGGAAGSGVAQPVAEEDEDGGGEDGEAWARSREGVEGEWRGEEEGEEEGCAEPVYRCGGGGEEEGGCVGDRGVGEPLFEEG